MTTIKQRIRMFAQWATAVGDIPSMLSLKSVAHSDHKTWVVTVDDFKGEHNQLTILVVDIGEGKYQINSLYNQILWSGIPSDLNFNLAMRSALVKLK